MIRGLRTLSDMEYEFTMSLMNLNLDPGIETVFLMAKEEFSHVSSSLLRQIAALGGDLSKFLPEPVRKALIETRQTLKRVPLCCTVPILGFMSCQSHRSCCSPYCSRASSGTSPVQPVGRQVRGRLGAAR